MREHIIDSQLSEEAALADNPANPTPAAIRDSLTILEVKYRGFDRQRHLGQIVVAQSVAEEVQAFFRQALAIEFPIEKVVTAADPRYQWDDEKLMADNASSGFNYRVIAGTDTPSLHAQGLAFDINTRLNPYTYYEKGKKILQPPGATWNKKVPGTLNADHPLVRMMERLGWEWGGHWTLEEDGMIDYQHFQKSP